VTKQQVVKLNPQSKLINQDDDRSIVSVL